MILQIKPQVYKNIRCKTDMIKYSIYLAIYLKKRSKNYKNAKLIYKEQQKKLNRAFRKVENKIF